MGKKKNDQKRFVVYSTNPEYDYNHQKPEQKTLPPAEQDLRVLLDKKKRGGKQVTLITGFVGSEDDLKVLGKMLKSKCGVGGSAKDGEIIVQGDNRKKVLALLEKDGYRCKLSGG